MQILRENSTFEQAYLEGGLPPLVERAEHNGGITIWTSPAGKNLFFVTALFLRGRSERKTN